MIGVAPIEKKLVQHWLRWFGHVQQRPREAPVRSGVLKRDANVKRAFLAAIDQLITSRKRDYLQLIHDEDIPARSSKFKERGVDPTELISFLLELSFHTLGAAYSLSTLTEVQKSAIRDLAELGLVKLQQGFVVVETNFRMYAYSTSKLHCEILRLFSRVEYQLPNLIAGAITKESIYDAFENGITAEQIISFLQQNAHPRVADKVPTVPENVTDQIRLWETDRNRVEMIPSHLYEDFPSKNLFEQCCDHARDNGYLLWEDPKRMRLIVRENDHLDFGGSKQFQGTVLLHSTSANVTKVHVHLEMRFGYFVLSSNLF
ncbi:hypothetical protein PR202_gb10617 [Eleusine coracana subsp. coracana]|uniref:RNA polymerase II transcription factor B subunit 2 n=1 Tax=Eleusine coracana subsp. coracana TaxID=191504 RepID=A0AAV5EKY6_ELECO|nr:hypothetical protein PR202_gb10617 [Eleusine coracana subsp. coracana]